MQRSVHVLVLGDVLRSPRIRNHAKSFAEMNWRVVLSGYGSAHTSLACANVHLSVLCGTPAFVEKVPLRLLSLFLKMIFLMLSLMIHLFRNFDEDLLVVQSPPAVPTLFVVWIFALFKRVPVLIDWHNYGYTILEESAGKSSLSSKVYKLLELDFSGSFLNSNAGVTTRHICVSKALKHDLFLRTRIKSDVVYDKPTADFQTTSLPMAHDLFTRLAQSYPQLGDNTPNRTVFTECDHLGNCKWRVDRPSLVVSSCSWTPDDDYTMMVEALDIYNSRVASSPNIGFHKLYCVITGRGPLREYFAELVDRQNWQHVVVIMPWLEWSDYPLLLGCADLGVSLHRSTSGLDLPMKIVDLFGGEVPVLALSYEALPELLPDRLAGCHFSSAPDLADHLLRLLIPKEDFEGSSESAELAHYRRYLHDWRQSGKNDWHSHWLDVAYPLCQELVLRSWPVGASV